MKPEATDRPGGWPAHYLSSSESARVPVTVTVDRLGIHFQLRDQPATWWPHSALDTGPDPDDPRHIRVDRRGTGEALVVLDASFREALAAQSPRAASLESHARGSGQKVALIVAGALGLVAALYFVGLPVIADVAARRVSVEFERELGDAVLEQLIADEPVCDDPVLTRAVGGIVARLENAIPEPRYQFRVTIVDDTLVNALAVPGGAMVLFRGLLQHTASPEELAGVLAHEMQHIELRHGTRAVMRQLPLQAVAGITGGAGDAVAVLGVLGALRYARADEEEADVEGMRLVVNARLDPSGMVSFFDTLARVAGTESPVLTYLSTHPSTETRRATLAAMAEASQVDVVPLELGAPWGEIVERCR